MDIQEQLLLSQGRMEGRLDQILQNLETIAREHAECHQRMRKVEATLQVHNVVGGGVAAVVVALATDYLRKKVGW
ncbi:MAG: hypothetical protein HQM01_13040 [Magnetococcales bacterium]|nr:hypothetical protein [Magnetococcales bacterium]